MKISLWFETKTGVVRFFTNGATPADPDNWSLEGEQEGDDAITLAENLINSWGVGRVITRIGNELHEIDTEEQMDTSELLTYVAQEDFFNKFR